ncbi:unnamed protein product [Closterium sp. Naga37s-1]|nr:unnamed protein product [Closterium sp. Naga37s-1]
MASGQEKDIAREEGPTAPNEVVNNAAEIDLNQDEAMADLELDDIENLDLDLRDEHNHGEAENHGEADNLGEEDNTGGKEATGDENDFTEGEGMTYPISEEIVQLQAKVATQNITILQQQTSIDGLKKHTQDLEARLSITMKEVTEFRRSLGTKNRQIEWLQKTCNNLQASFNKLNEQLTHPRREGIYEPPPGRRPAPGAQPAPASPAPTPARVTAATRALDEVARRAVYGAKKQAQGPFGWPEFCTALKEAFMVKKSNIELRGRLESIKCHDRSVQKYAVEFEAAARSLQKPLSEEEMMHVFMKGLPVNLQEAHMTGGMTNWTTYKEMKEQMIKTDTIIRTYIHGPAKPDQQPRAEGSGGRENRPQNANGGGVWPPSGAGPCGLAAAAPPPRHGPSPAGLRRPRPLPGAARAPGGGPRRAPSLARPRAPREAPTRPRPLLVGSGRAPLPGAAPAPRAGNGRAPLPGAAPAPAGGRRLRPPPGRGPGPGPRGRVAATPPSPARPRTRPPRAGGGRAPGLGPGLRGRAAAAPPSPARPRPRPPRAGSGHAPLPGPDPYQKI